jgi:GNAT superfamily N-acetyltransferase
VSRVNVRVRPAIEDDIPALATFVRSLDTSTGQTSGKPLSELGEDHLGQRFGAVIADDERVLLVAAEESGSIVGFLSARRDEIGAFDLTPVLHIAHLLVAPGHRRRGIGRTLIAAAVNLAEDHGVEHMLATVPAGSREGNRYLARIGFAPLVVHRVAATSALRRSLGMTDVAGRMAVLRRARLARAQRAGFTPARAVRGA